MSVRLSSAIAASLLVIVPALASAQSLTFEKTVTVGASPSLDVSTGSGEVTVQAGSGNAMVIKGTVKVRTGWNVPSNAADLAQRLRGQPADHTERRRRDRGQDHRRGHPPGGVGLLPHHGARRRPPSRPTPAPARSR